MGPQSNQLTKLGLTQFDGLVVRLTEKSLCFRGFWQSILVPFAVTDNSVAEIKEPMPPESQKPGSSNITN